jgi:hypothetical protein
MLKEYGGMGIPSIRELNLCLLGFWLKRYSADEGKLWKSFVDFKYNNSNPNIFTCREAGASNFWKGVLWAAKVAKFGYRWKIGKWNKVRFWKDVWIGIVNLAIQYWELYYLVNEQNKSVAELWDGECLRCTFHRCVDRRLLLMSEELVNLVSTVELSEEHDAMA